MGSPVDPSAPPGLVINPDAAPPGLVIPGPQGAGNAPNFGGLEGTPRNIVHAGLSMVPILGGLANARLDARNKPNTLQNLQESVGLGPDGKPAPGPFIRGVADVGSMLLPMAGSQVTMGARPLVKMAIGAISGAAPEALRIGADMAEGAKVGLSEAGGRLLAAGGVNALLEGGISKASQIIQLKRYAGPNGPMEASVDHAYSQAMDGIARNPSLTGPDALALAADTHANIGSQMYEDLKNAGGDSPVVNLRKVTDAANNFAANEAKANAKVPRSTAASKDYQALYQDMVNAGSTPATVEQGLGVLKVLNAAKVSPDPQVGALANKLLPVAHNAVTDGVAQVGPDATKLWQTIQDYYGPGKQDFGQRVIQGMIANTPDKAAGAVLNGGRDVAQLTKQAMSYSSPQIQDRFKRNVIQELVQPGGISDPDVLSRLQAAKPAIDVLFDSPKDVQAIKNLNEIATLHKALSDQDPGSLNIVRNLVSLKIGGLLGLKSAAAEALTDSTLTRLIYNPEASTQYVQGLRKVAAGDAGTFGLNIARAIDAGYKGVKLFQNDTFRKAFEAQATAPDSPPPAPAQPTGVIPQ